MELIFEVRDAEEGGFYARLRANVLEATSLHFEEEEVQPLLARLLY